MPHPKGKGKDHPLFGAVHDWLRRHHPRTGKCEIDPEHEGRTEWTLRRPDVREYAKDISLFVELCPSCHRLREHGWTVIGNGAWLCPRGHLVEPGGENDYRSPKGERKCWACITERNRAKGFKPKRKGGPGRPRKGKS